MFHVCRGGPSDEPRDWGGHTHEREGRGRVLEGKEEEREEREGREEEEEEGREEREGREGATHWGKDQQQKDLRPV